MDIGIEFTYMVRETVSDRNCVSTYKEKYVLEDVKGDDMVFSVYKDDVFTEKVNGRVSYGNGHIRNDNLIEKSEEYLGTVFGPKKVKVMISSLCGGSITLYQGDLVYKYIQTQMWSGGTIFEKTCDLIGYKSE